MTPERWRRVAGVLEVVLELDRPLRNVYLASIATGDAELALQVRKLLTELDLTEIASVGSDEEVAATSADRLGPYKLISVLGSGGMGTVFLAERDDQEYQRQVAIKVLHDRYGVSVSRQRFLAERQILASFDHPHIARMFDAGTTPDGRPYLVLELIDGRPIHQYCDEEKLGVAARLEILKKICSAVAYAHRNLVVHRDIKPSNILIDASGVPRLLDFGIAKILEGKGNDQDLTGTNDRPMTPSYASYEQLAGSPITTATDIFALGVLAYRLLAGRLPFLYRDTSPQSMLEVQAAALKKPSHVAAEWVDDDDPSAILSRTWSSALIGDLDNIVLRALSRDPDSRYGSVDELQDDLANYLNGHPVRASGVSWAYRARKFVRRNRLPVGLAAGLLLSWAVGTGFLGYQRGLILEEKAKLQTERDRAQELSEFLVGIFEKAGPDEDTRRTATVESLIDRVANELVAESLGRAPLTRAKLMTTMAHIYGSLGRPGQAIQLLEKSLALHRKHSAPKDRDMGIALHLLGEACTYRQDFQRSEDALRESLEIFEGLDEEWSAVSLSELGRLRLYQNRRAEGVELGRQALRKIDSLATASLEGRVGVRQTLGYLLVSNFQNLEGEAVIEETIELLRNAGRLDARRHSQMLGDLSAAFIYQNKIQDAVVAAEESVKIMRSFFGAESALATSLHNLAWIYALDGNFQRALELYDEVLSIWPADSGYGLYNRGALRLAQGDLQGAESDLVRSLSVYEAKVSKSGIAFDDPARGIPTALTNHLGETLWRLGRSAEALKVIERSLAKIARLDDSQRSSINNRNPWAIALVYSALIYRSLGNQTLATSHFEKAIEVSHQPAEGERIPRLVLLEAKALLFLGRIEEARPLIDELVALKYKLFHLEDFCQPDPTTSACKEASRLDLPSQTLETKAN